MANVKIGWGEETFEFSKPVSLVGQFAERISEYVEKPITATAMAVEAGDEQMVICAAELVGISGALLEEVRDRLRGKVAGLDVDKIVISATHIHTGPGYTGRTFKSKAAVKAGSTGFRALLESELPPDKKYVESANLTQNDAITSNDEGLDGVDDDSSREDSTPL